MSPVCAASSPRQRRLAARAEARSSRRAFPSYQPRSSHRLLAPTELDQRFDVVDDEADGRRLDDRLTAYEFERWIKTCDHPFRGHGCVLGVADRRRGHELDVPAPPSSQFESAIGSVLRLLDPTQLSMGEAL